MGQCLCCPDVDHAVFVTTFVKSIWASARLIRAIAGLGGGSAVTVLALQNSERKEFSVFCAFVLGMH